MLNRDTRSVFNGWLLVLGVLLERNRSHCVLLRFVHGRRFLRFAST